MSKFSIIFKDLLNDDNDSEDSILIKYLVPKLKLLTPPILNIETLLSKDPKSLYLLIPCSLHEAIRFHQLSASAILNNSNNFDVNENIPNLLSWKNFQNAYEPIKNISKHRPSGFIQLDHLLTTEQGFPSSSAIEIIGSSGSGKTQLILFVAASNAISGFRVLLIDTCSGISIKRLLEIISSKLTIDGKTDFPLVSKAMSLIHIEKINDPWLLLDILCAVKDNSIANPSYDTIIVDCLHHIFSPYAITQGGYGFGTNTGGLGGSNVSLDLLVGNIGICLKSLTSIGSTVIITNTLVSASVKSSKIRLPSNIDITLSSTDKQVQRVWPEYNFVNVIDCTIVLTQGKEGRYNKGNILLNEYSQLHNIDIENRINSLFFVDIVLNQPYYSSLPKTCVLDVTINV